MFWLWLPRSKDVLAPAWRSALDCPAIFHSCPCPERQSSLLNRCGTMTVDFGNRMAWCADAGEKAAGCEEMMMLLCIDAGIGENETRRLFPIHTSFSSVLSR